MPPNLKPEVPLSLASCVTLAFAVMLLLPISQWITAQVQPADTGIDPTQIKPPVVDPVTIVEPPKVEQQIELKEPKPDLQPPPLDVMEGIAEGSGGIPVQFDYGIIIPDDIYDGFIAFEDLTEKPRPTGRLDIQYPLAQKQIRASGHVVAIFEVKSDGTVGKITIEKSSHPDFSESVIRALTRARFEPGKQDGRAVNTRVRQEFPFQLN